MSGKRWLAPPEDGSFAETPKVSGGCCRVGSGARGVDGVEEGDGDDLSEGADVALDAAAEEEEKDAEEDMERGECGRRDVKKPKMLQKPNSELVEAHERTHLPFRSWCEACVKGRGKEEACKKRSGEDAEREMPEVHFDFCFPKHEDKEGVIILCGRWREVRG